MLHQLQSPYLWVCFKRLLKPSSEVKNMDSACHVLTTFRVTIVTFYSILYECKTLNSHSNLVYSVECIFSCGKQLHCLPCLSVCLSQLLTRVLPLDLHEIYARHLSHKMFAARTVSGQNFKGQVRRSHQKFLSCPVSPMTGRTPFRGRKLKDQRHTSSTNFYRVRFMAPCLFCTFALLG